MCQPFKQGITRFSCAQIGLHHNVKVWMPVSTSVVDRNHIVWVEGWKWVDKDNSFGKFENQKGTKTKCNVPVLLFFQGQASINFVCYFFMF